MFILTVEMLDPNTLYRLGHYFDYSIFRKGQELYQQNPPTILAFDGETARCIVRERLGSQTVVLQATGVNNLQVSCDCHLGKQDRICPHMIAAMLAARQYIQTTALQHWRYQLQRGLSQPVQAARGKNSAPYLVIFSLLSRTLYNNPTWSLQLHTLNARSWPALLPEDAPPDAEIDWKVRLEQNRGWEKQLVTPNRPLALDSCLNLSAAEIPVLNIMYQNQWYYTNLSAFAMYLPLLAKWRAPLYLSEQVGVLQRPLEILTTPVNIEAALGRIPDGLVLQTGLRLGERVFSSITDSLHIISQDPLWVQAGDYVAQVANPEALSVMRVAPLTIPTQDEKEFRDTFFPDIAARVPIQGEVVTWEDIHTAPTPRLYLSDADGTLRAEMRFGYSEHEVPCERNPLPIKTQDIPNSWTIIRIYRETEQEEAFYQLLTDAAYGLKRAGREQPYGTFELRARIHPYDFLSRCIPALTQAGFEIYGEQQLKSGRINRATPTLSLGISSGLDWFDLEAVVRYGDQEVNLHDVRKALRKGQRYVKLADGSLGELPEAWMERYKRLFDMAEETAEGLRIAEYHLPLLDPLLDDAAQLQADAEFEGRRQRLRDFRRIEHQPLPAGFTGELRPYQHAGLDWLHFLNHYGFGGCLADDMGLGKTIQVLVLLQSLREQGKAEGASLLVVPKSLLVNWQREAKRFTPTLRILEYSGNTRNKDTETFKDYDVILTTYGIMLRDIPILAKYRFNYAILDESQAIKNPLAKSSRAARQLQAAHRLVLTGTPVENNTFELWSQFAFLNPGLLGNVDYFKQEFAGPIQRGEGEEAAALLRQLIYPFILRRTKAQVAPELPPRTERVLYVDMEPAQRKLYKKTRDYYRALLLGMIEDGGIDDTRMKILEGLLRLRQVSIHPALVEPTYRGDAPKFELLMETLDTLQGEGHKALIFSQFVEVLSLLRHQLHAQKIPYAYLDGKTRDRQGQVDAFQNDPALPFFLISLKAGGVGLNLTAADYVIHLDPWWNPAVEQQASDRTHRIGQDKPVFIYKLITRDSVEEKILQLQEHKKQLVEQLISEESSFFKSLTVEDIQVLFS